MSKVGRNEPCPCGSGRKYKKCCEPCDQELSREQSRRAEAESLAAITRALAEEIELASALHTGEHQDERDDAVYELSDRVDALVKAGRFDEAEATARKLEADYPDEPVGTECLASVYEARGLNQAAAELYRRAAAGMKARGEGNFCECCHDRMLELAQRLDTAPSAHPLPRPEPA
jgi:predicted Zn-dependent protease